jgi:hypothetical protein
MWLRVTTINQTTGTRPTSPEDLMGSRSPLSRTCALVVAVGSVATKDYAVPGSELSFC